MATATKQTATTVTLVMTGEEAESLRRYLGARASDKDDRKGVAVTDNIYTALAGSLAPF